MSSPIAVNNISHAKTKINTAALLQPYQQQSSTLTFATEFAEIQREFPILFSKSPENGQFQAVVLMGLKEGENLFFTNEHWQARYTPNVFAKGPFVIGYEADAEHNTQKAIICLDMNAECVNENKGEALFDDKGESSHFLNTISQCLANIDQGNQINQQMFAAFTKHDLIEAVSLDIELNNGETITLAGNYTINAKQLSTLSGDALAELNQQGFLQLAYFVMTSLNNVQHLVDLKNLQIKNS